MKSFLELPYSLRLGLSFDAYYLCRLLVHPSIAITLH